MSTLPVALRPLAEADLPLLQEWLAQPRVSYWWREPASEEAVRSNYLPAIQGEDPTENMIILVEERPVGLVQRYLLRDDPEWAEVMAATGLVTEGAACLDYLIGEADMTRRGIASTTLRACAVELFGRGGEAPVERIFAAPQQENIASCRALEKAGFRRRWAGQLVSDDPSDAGPAFVYELTRGSLDA